MALEHEALTERIIGAAIEVLYWFSVNGTNGSAH
jgi:hypothetical protein